MKTIQKGFTLIEIMIVVAIIGIIAAIAYPSYASNIRATNRKGAIAEMLTIQQELSRQYNVNNGVFPNTYAPIAFGSPKRYDITVVFANAFQTYTITATATGDQLSDKCEHLTLQSSGNTSSTKGSNCF